MNIAVIRERCYQVMIPTLSNEANSRYFNIGMLVLISLNVLAVVFETEESLYLQYKYYFDGFEFFSIVIFTLEYVLRLWVCTEQKEPGTPVVGRLRYALQPAQIIDLLAFLPFYLPFLGLDLRFIRAIRLFRFFRLFKMGRYSQSLTSLGNVIRRKKEELSITLFAGLVILIIASSSMYLVEHDAQADKFSSIPQAMWWGVATLTTVGYGDVYPVTPLGKIISAFIAVLGIGLFALPAGIVASGFASEIHKEKSELKVCPHCGKPLDQ